MIVLYIVVYIAKRRSLLYAVATANYESKIKELSLEDRLSRSPIAKRMHRLARCNPPELAEAADISSLKSLIDENIPSFLETVNSSQQTLNEQEYVVCMLTRLAFSSVSIDRLTGVSEGYTSRLKSRLYKKLTGEEGNAKEFERWIMAIR